MSSNGEIMKNLKLFIREFAKSNLLFHSAQNAFYFTLSIFPFLYLITKILIIFPIPSENFLKGIKILVPEETLQIIYTGLKTVSETSNAIHSFSYIVVALWSSSMLIYSLKSLFSTFYNQKPTKNRILTRILSLAITTVILITIIFTFIAVFFINLALNIIIKNSAIKYSPGIVSAISLVLIIFDIILLYIILPPVKVKISHALPGAIITAVSLTIFSFLFSYYVSYIADYSRFYGALGGVVTLLLWFYISSVIILSGGLINAKFFNIKDTL